MLTLLQRESRRRRTTHLAPRDRHDTIGKPVLASCAAAATPLGTRIPMATIARLAVYRPLPRWSRERLLQVLTGLAILLLCGVAQAHGIAGDDQAFLLRATGPHIGPYIYLGAKHMVTGYDHLLFLAGVIFFLYRLKDVALYVTLFAVGHSTTLLAGGAWGLARRLLSRRRRDWFVRRLQGVREHRRISPTRIATEHQGRSVVLRLLPRPRPRDQAAGSWRYRTTGSSPTWCRSM